MHRVDSHQHFWHYQSADYPWISDSMLAIRKDFLPADLEPELVNAGISASIAVQARQDLQETEWLLDLAEQNPNRIVGVVGWVPFTSSNLPRVLARLTQRPALKGVRHVIHDEPDNQFILREDFNQGVAQLLDFKLVYDILIREHHLKSTIEFVDRHPQQSFVVDHIAKPKIATGERDPWERNIRELAQRSNVVCKLSGVATEADHQHWTRDQLLPYLDVVLSAFGPHRLLFGSDWPVCLLAVSYVDWVQLLKEYLEALTLFEQESIFGNNARRVYHLPNQ